MMGWLRRAWRGEPLTVDLRTELAKLGVELVAERRRSAQLAVDNEGLAIRWRSANAERLALQVRVEQARRILAGEGIATDRVSRALRVLEAEPEQTSGGEPT